MENNFNNKKSIENNAILRDKHYTFRMAFRQNRVKIEFQSQENVLLYSISFNISLVFGNKYNPNITFSRVKIYCISNNLSNVF